MNEYLAKIGGILKLIKSQMGTIFEGSNFGT